MLVLVGAEERGEKGCVDELGKVVSAKRERENGVP